MTVARNENNSEPTVAMQRQQELGKKIFNTQCANCHSILANKIAPPLAGVESRWKSRKEILKFINNPPGYMYLNKDKYAFSLFKKYGYLMQSYLLTEAQVNAILDFIKSEEKRLK